MLTNLKIPGPVFLLIPFSNIKKRILTNLKTSLFVLILILTEIIYIKNHRLLTTCIKNDHTNNSHKNHYTNNFIIINQINKHKAKIYNCCMYTRLIIKNFLLFYKKFYNYIKKIFFIPQI